MGLRKRRPRSSLDAGTSPSNAAALLSPSPPTAALKNRDSQLQAALSEMWYESLLLLTGTPLQNDVAELWALLHLIDGAKFPSKAEFAARYGTLSTAEEVGRLQTDIGPIMLRRVKEDVEKSIPPKEETLINVELTRLQKAYYRAVFDRNRGFLARGAATAPVASLVNIEMELRKCCNHPFLLRGAEDRETATCRTRAERAEVMIAASGKMVLLDKLLPKLRSEGEQGRDGEWEGRGWLAACVVLPRAGGRSVE
jgi:SNF2 family DNA or RNA helicase